MSKAIWKYPLEITNAQIIKMPKGAKILSVQIQNKKPCIWVMVDPDNDLLPKTLYSIGTGFNVDDEIDNDIETRYIGTYQVQGGSFVFHVFEEVE